MKMLFFFMKGLVMANLQVKGIDDELYEELKLIARSENRSISQEILFLVKSHMARKRQTQGGKTGAEVLLELSGSWEDSRSGKQIVRDLRSARKTSGKLRKGF